MDIRTIFFNGVLEVEIHMDQLERVVQKGDKYFVCKLKKI
jgi:hypothetical protein